MKLYLQIYSPNLSKCTCHVSVDNDNFHIWRENVDIESMYEFDVDLSEQTSNTYTTTVYWGGQTSNDSATITATLTDSNGKTYTTSISVGIDPVLAN